VEYGSRARNWVLELEEQNVGVEVMLLRARDNELRLCGERPTGTRRWRPADARLIVARAREATRGEELDRERKRATRGCDPSRRWRCGGGREAAGAKHCRRQASRAGAHVREEEEERGEVRGTCL
jgi:hypothetical protein